MCCFDTRLKHGAKAQHTQLPVVDINCYDKIGQQSDLESLIQWEISEDGQKRF